MDLLLQLGRVKMQLKRSVLLILMIIFFVYFEIHSCSEDSTLAPAVTEVESEDVIYRARDIYFIDDTTGWMVGSKGTIASSTDGGNTWTGQLVDSCDFRDVQFLDESNGWLAGKDGALFNTGDGGSTWSKVVSGGYPVDEDFSQLHILGQSVGFVQGFLGVYRTEDGGLEWQNYWLPFVPYKGAWSMSFIDVHTGYLLGTRWMEADPILLYSTNDGGVTWQGITEARSTVLRGIITIAFADASTGWAGGSVIMKTVDGGRTWETQLESAVVREFVFFNKLTGYAIGGGSILKTTDGGTTWMNIAPEDDRVVDLRGCYFLSESKGWVVGLGTEETVGARVLMNSVILKTEDGGASWTVTESAYDCTELLLLSSNPYSQ
jgi:photosystem II stability/assembly factor-like uncharacterized protein